VSDQVSHSYKTTGRIIVSGGSLRVGPITRPEESYRLWCVWVWSWSLDNEKTTTGGSCTMVKKNASLMMNTRGQNKYLLEYFILKSCVSLVIYIFFS
jgi:hypothetical protein